MGKIDYGTAVEIVKRAGSILKESRGSETNFEEKGLFNFVTEMDVKIQDYLIQEFKRTGGELNFIGEESEKNTYHYEDVWVIDPIDGTTNFMHGYPNFCIAVAHVIDHEINYSVIYNPISEELFTAEKGKGAYLNGKRIRVSKINQMKDAIIVVGFPYDRQKGAVMFDIMRELYKKSSDVKRRGSASLDFADVACGRSEAYYEMNLRLWDIAPGYLLVTEAGGMVKCSVDLLGGADIFHVMATNNLFEIKELEDALNL